MNDDSQLRAESAEIEGLLEEARELVAASTWQRVEDVIGRVVRQYGDGLAHALGHARTAGAVGDQLDGRLADDALLASLLALHGLHPLTTEQRVERALAAIRDRLAIGADALALVELVRGVARIEVSDEVAGAFADAIRGVIQSAAPELAAIELDSPLS